MRTRMLFLAAALTALTLMAAGCGSDDDDDNGSSGSGSADQQSDDSSSGAYGAGGGDESGGTGGGAAAELKLTADPGGALKFDKTELTAKPGKVKILMDNPSDVPHAVEVEGNGVEEETKTVTGASSDVTVDLKAGEYEFYCPVDGHKEAGMEGTLTVG